MINQHTIWINTCNWKRIKQENKLQKQPSLSKGYQDSVQVVICWPLNSSTRGSWGRAENNTSPLAPSISSSAVPRCEQPQELYCNSNSDSSNTNGGGEYFFGSPPLASPPPALHRHQRGHHILHHQPVPLYHMASCCADRWWHAARHRQGLDPQHGRDQQHSPVGTHGLLIRRQWHRDMPNRW
jgi:hypothetical protein